MAAQANAGCLLGKADQPLLLLLLLSTGTLEAIAQGPIHARSAKGFPTAHSFLAAFQVAAGGGDGHGWCIVALVMICDGIDRVMANLVKWKGSQLKWTESYHKRRNSQNTAPQLPLLGNSTS